MDNQLTRQEQERDSQALMTAPPGTTIQRIDTSTNTIHAISVQYPRDLDVVGVAAAKEAVRMGEDFYWSFPVKRRNEATGRVEEQELTGPTIAGALMMVQHWKYAKLAHVAYERGWPVVQFAKPHHRAVRRVRTAAMLAAAFAAGRLSKRVRR